MAVPFTRLRNSLPFSRLFRCSANAQKIRALSLESPTKKAIVRYREPKDEDKVKVVNLPTTVDKIQYPTVEGTVHVTNFNQKFFYFACSKCRKATNASEDGEFWCNYCMEKVPASPSSACFVASSREKLNTDATFHGTEQNLKSRSETQHDQWQQFLKKLQNFSFRFLEKK